MHAGDVVGRVAKRIDDLARPSILACRHATSSYEAPRLCTRDHARGCESPQADTVQYVELPLVDQFQISGSVGT